MEQKPPGTQYEPKHENARHFSDEVLTQQIGNVTVDAYIEERRRGSADFAELRGEYTTYSAHQQQSPLETPYQ